MCGLCGLYEPGRDLESDLAAMMSTLVHRGPDGSGRWQEGDLGLGHRRLAILDLNPTGQQPMVTSCGRYVGVFNGEIYNYLDLRRELAATGRDCRGASDTEVLLEGFAQWGETIVPRLRGMFAVAIWDLQEHRLFLARDHLGKKPLYIQITPTGIRFASELRALRVLGRCEIDRRALGLYFHFGYVPEPRTIYREITTLPPASHAWWRPGGALRIQTYWMPPTASRSQNKPQTAQNLEDELDDLLLGAVRRRLYSDVRIGTFLSGGMDSALIASYVTKLQPGTPAITVGFNVARWDEREAARDTAKLVGVDHIVEVAQALDARQLMAEYAECFDTPFADSSGIPTLVLARTTRKSVTVVLGGDGGDEAFGGYDRYRWHAAIRPWLRWPGLLRLAAGAAISKVDRDRGARVARMLRLRDERDLYTALLGKWHCGSLADLLLADFDDPWLWSRAQFVEVPGDDLMQLQRHDLKAYLPFDILVKVDRATMWHSLEARSPLLDVDVIEWALTRGRTPAGRRPGKYWLRRMLARRLPGFPLDRPKRGFALPCAEWLAGPLREPLLAAADPEFLARQGLFRAATIEAVIAAFLRGEHGLHTPLWTFLAFQNWYRRHYADGALPETARLAASSP